MVLHWSAYSGCLLIFFYFFSYGVAQGFIFFLKKRYFYFLGEVGNLSYSSFRDSHWPQGHLCSFLVEVENPSYFSFRDTVVPLGHLCSTLSSAVAEVPLAPRRPRCVVFFCLLEPHDSSFLFATITLSARRYLDVYLVILGNHYFSNQLSTVYDRDHCIVLALLFKSFGDQLKMLTEYGILFLLSLPLRPQSRSDRLLCLIDHKLNITVLLFIVLLKCYRLFLPFVRTIILSVVFN